jgi:hypothetical protein
MTTETKPRPFHVLHARRALPEWRTFCGHRHAVCALPLKADKYSQGRTFGESLEENRCIKCNARYHMIQARAAKKLAADADGQIVKVLS